MLHRIDLAAWAMLPLSAFAPVARSASAGAAWSAAAIAAAVGAAACLLLVFAPPFVMLLAAFGGLLRFAGRAVIRMAGQVRRDWHALCDLAASHHFGPHAPQAL